MATIDIRKSPGGSISYRVRIQKRGEPTISATFPSRKLALEWAKMTEGQMIEGRHFPSRKPQHTLNELIGKYLTTVMPKKTKETQQTHMAPLRFWKERLGHKLLTAITRADVIQYRDELEGRAPATVCKYLSLLSGVLNLGVKELGWIDQNVVSTISRPSLPPGRTRFLSDDERHRLLEECKKSKNTFLFPLVALALYTCLRRSSLLSLKKQDISLKDRVIYISKLKNKSVLVLPIVGQAMEIIQWLLSQNTNDDYLFPGYEKGKSGWNHYDTAFEHALKRANISNFPYHCLRHSGASYMVQAGVPLYVVGAILNHKTIAMTARYSHLATENLKGALEVLAQRLEG